MKTHYDKLGVTPHASHADIEQTYRHSLSELLTGNRSSLLCKKEQLRLQHMREAYLTLSAPGSRLEYDLHLDQLEHARLRILERIGIVIGLAMLFAGLTLIAIGYYQQVVDDQPVLQLVEHRHEATDAARENTVLASSAQNAAIAATEQAD